MDSKLEKESELTLLEYCLSKSEEQLKQGKSVWIEDALTGESHTHADFDIETRKVASFFYKHGLRKGDTVIYMTYDVVNIHVIMCGVWRANGIMRATYPEEDEETVKERIIESSSKWIICDVSHVDMLVRIKDSLNFNLQIVVVGGSPDCIALSSIFQDDGSECPRLEITQDDPALILCTSGTTGKAKGAVYTHESFRHALIAMAGTALLVENQLNLCLVKGTHIGGVMFPLFGLLVGKTILVMSVINKENIFKAVENFKPGYIFGFPTFILPLITDPAALRIDITSVRIVAIGGGVITPAMEETLKKFPNLESCLKMYGMTECCPIAVSVDPSTKVPINTPPFSVGKVVPGAEVIIRDLTTGNNKVLGHNERGEICIRARRTFNCYLNNPKCTAESFIDGFFHTGDVGYFDENNFLFMVERVKELIKYGANHIAPSEIEEIVSQHHEIREACVFGVEDPDGNDMIPRAVVTLKRFGGAKAEEILEFANSRLASYKHIRGGVFIVDELPNGKTGKVTRNLVAAMPL